MGANESTPLRREHVALGGSREWLFGERKQHWDVLLVLLPGGIARSGNLRAGTERTVSDSAKGRGEVSERPPCWGCRITALCWFCAGHPVTASETAFELHKRWCAILGLNQVPYHRSRSRRELRSAS